MLQDVHIHDMVIKEYRVTNIKHVKECILDHENVGDLTWHLWLEGGAK